VHADQRVSPASYSGTTTVGRTTSAIADRFTLDADGRQLRELRMTSSLDLSMVH
jgi:hypothetical protein